MSVSLMRYRLVAVAEMADILGLEDQPFFGHRPIEMKKPRGTGNLFVTRNCNAGMEGKKRNIVSAVSKIKKAFVK